MIDLSDTLYQQESSIRPVIAAGDTVIAAGDTVIAAGDTVIAAGGA